MFVRASAYARAGEFDEAFFAHMEEIDLCWRLKRCGYSIIAVPGSTVYHVGGGTLPNNNPHKLYLNYRNNLFLLFKNLPGYQVCPVIMMRMILDGMSAIVYLCNGSFSFFKAVIRAHLAFYRRIPMLVKKRRQLKAGFRTGNTKEIYRNSIVIDFFIRKKHYFSQLDW
jgi:GT2 family glycosyltransferase